MTKEYFDVVVIVPLEEELIEVLSLFPTIEDRSSSTEFRHVANSGNPEIRLLIAQQVEMGKSSASKAVAGILDCYDAGLVICLGIAGGLSHDLRLGDVCYSGDIIDVYDNSKVVDRQDGGSETELSPTFFNTPMEFTSTLNFIRTQPELRPKYAAWQEAQKALVAELVGTDVAGRDGTPETLAEPKTMPGSIVCGAVSKSASYNERLRAIERKVLALDTESGGVFATAKERNTPALTIRGISDYADKGKSRLERTSKGNVRKLAALNAASFLKLQLSNLRFVAAIKRRKIGSQSELSLLEVKSAADPLSAVLASIAVDIEAALHRLSPEYRLQPKGYRLPLPRVRLSEREDGTEDLVALPPIEIIEAATKHNRLILRIPRTYPDQGLAWIIADQMLSSEIDGQQVIPIVIDGSAIKGTGKGFSASQRGLDEIATMPGTQVVFIIENVPLDSKHRLGLLVKEMETYTNGKYVFVVRGDANLMVETDFQSKIGATPFEVCPIPFIEIAQFIRQNFSMTGSEAEVVALRLRDTFDRFDLDAHPTYFAGISKETLIALLQANRRSELIQLAVDGFLTFLVAGDRQDIALSRSTRARFLRKLVVEMRVEKRSFNQEQLVGYTREFAKQHDFDINPIAFIQAFVDQGILHFDHDNTHISLPFIESYLLASELAANSEKAIRYFQLDDPSFDLATFDLYSEIGASSGLIESVQHSLQAAVSTLEIRGKEPHILLTETISPSNIRRPERANALRKRLKSAADAVQKGLDKTNEKQQSLDLSERIRAETGKQRKIQQKKIDGGKPDKAMITLTNVVRHWVIATVLLGSGAEHLDAQTKRGLSATIVGVAAKIIDEWSRIQQQIDFKELKKALSTDEALEQLPGDQDIDEKRRFVNGIVDLLEYSAMADPLRRVTGYLCEQARHRVLATSIENAECQGLVEKVIHGTWLADIDSSKGQKVLRDAIRDLPTATFFRITLASHYLSRVYWNHWQTKDRMVLLEAAEELIKPLNMSLNKPELKRFIERKPKKKK